MMALLHPILRFVTNPYRAYGSYIYENYTWPSDHQLLKLYQRFYGRSVKRVKDRHFNLLNLCKLVQDVKGDTAECGVREGFSSYLIMMATQNEKSAKMHWAFDSFEGLSAPSAEDFNGSAPIQWKKGDLAVSLEDVKANFSKFDFSVQLCPGWIPECFERIPDDKVFSFVHIDVDLYEPTIESVKFFLPRLAKNGILLFDDYGSPSCIGAKKAIDEVIDRERLVSISTSQSFFINS